MAILNHDFIETNADTFMLTIPFTLINSYSFYTGGKSQEDLFFDTFLLSLCIFVSLTNEFHKVGRFLVVIRSSIFYYYIVLMEKYLK